MSEDEGAPVGSVLLTIGLICLSGAFSGLTLGLLSLSLESLELVMSSGSPRDARHARQIYPIRKHGNLLLCTLLLGNTLTNVLIAIISASFLSAGVGAIVATLLIVIFGEIIPQAVCQRHGLRVGAGSRLFVIPLMLVLLPVTFPIAKLLDMLLGSEMRTMYNKRQLDRLLDVNASGAEAGITHDDRKLLSSALAFSEKRVDSIMTQLKDVFMVSLTDKLNYDTLKAVYESGYTRVPVYHIRRSTVVGLLFAKDLILVDPHDEIPVAALLALCARPQQVHVALASTKLDAMLQKVQGSRMHMWFITSHRPALARRLDAAAGAAGVPPSGAPAASPPPEHRQAAENVVGIVTMEDILEELIQDEIVDETDRITDNKTKRRVAEHLLLARLEFFEMLQRREVMALGHGSALTAKAVEEVRALTSFLSTNVSHFRPSAFSAAALRRLVQRCPIYTISASQAAEGHFIFVRGVPATCCCLLLHGRVQVRAGNEGLVSDIGPWTMLAVNALLEHNYVADFTARVVSAARVLIIPRAEWLAVSGGSIPASGTTTLTTSAPLQKHPNSMS